MNARTSSNVLDYIKYCIDRVTADKCIWVYPKTKNDNRSAERSAQRVQQGYNTSRANLKRDIREAKDAFRRVEYCFRTKVSRQVWQGVQHISNYRHRNVSGDVGDASPVEHLNC